MSNAKLGIGLATGMAFHAPANTALPTYPTDIIGDNGDGSSTDNFTATSGQSTFTLTEAANEIISFTVDGVEQASTDYSVSSTTVTWSGSSFTGGEKVKIVYYIGVWRIIGDVTHDGLTVATDKSVNNIRNWANVIKRSTLSEHTETVQVPIMDTTEEALKVVVGSSNVTVTAATLTHGKTIDVDLSAGSLPSPEAFMFITMSDLILVWFLVLLLLYNLIKNVDYTGVILLYKSPKCNLQSRKKKKTSINTC